MDMVENNLCTFCYEVPVLVMHIILYLFSCLEILGRRIFQKQ